jgi:hypothetical protein
VAVGQGKGHTGEWRELGFVVGLVGLPGFDKDCVLDLIRNEEARLLGEAGDVEFEE